MASLTNLQKRYTRSLENNDFYSAEQAVRMMHHRLTQPKSASPADYARAYSILVDATKTLLIKHQTQAGAALALLVVKHNEDHKVAASTSVVSTLVEIADTFKLPPDADNTAAEELTREKLRFLKAAVAWSARKDCNGSQNGHPRLNALAAKTAADAGDFDLAQRLFICSDSPKDFATVLFEYATEKTLPSEQALVLARAVLKYLVTENIKDAITLRKEFLRLQGWSSVEDDNVATTAVSAPPLANFCELLICLCQLEASAAPLYRSVVSTYEPELKRDENLSPMLTKIGTMYFGIQPPQPTGIGGMMNSMLRGLMAS